MALNLLGKKTSTSLDDGLEPAVEAIEDAGTEDTGNNAKKTKKGSRSKGQALDGHPDLSKLKKKELLEILVAQGEEIDALRAQVLALQTQLDEKEFQMQNVGSIAEASLQVTDIFKEAEKAARIYLENIRRRYV